LIKERLSYFDSSMAAYTNTALLLAGLGHDTLNNAGPAALGPSAGPNGLDEAQLLQTRLLQQALAGAAANQATSQLNPQLLAQLQRAKLMQAAAGGPATTTQQQQQQQLLAMLQANPALLASLAGAGNAVSNACFYALPDHHSPLLVQPTECVRDCYWQEICPCFDQDRAVHQQQILQ
jgi:hypothetical protein